MVGGDAAASARRVGQRYDGRTQAHVPAEISFQTKSEIALALVDEANTCRVAHACVTGDAD